MEYSAAAPQPRRLCERNHCICVVFQQRFDCFPASFSALRARLWLLETYTPSVLFIHPNFFEVDFAYLNVSTKSVEYELPTFNCCLPAYEKITPEPPKQPTTRENNGFFLLFPASGNRHPRTALLSVLSWASELNLILHYTPLSSLLTAPIIFGLPRGQLHSPTLLGTTE